MRPAWYSRAAARGRPAAATWPAPATEGLDAGQVSPCPCHHGGLGGAVSPGYAGPVPIGCLPFTPPERIFPGAAGIPSVRLSETLTLMHVHPRLRSNVTPVVQPANQACSPA